MPNGFKFIEGFDARYKLFPDGTVVSSATNNQVRFRDIGNNKAVILFNGQKNIGFTISKLLESHFGIKRYKSHKIKSLEGEIWAPIPSYESLYMISTCGRVKAHNVTYIGERLLKPTPHKRGQLSISLSKNNHRESFIVCNLMGKVFLPNPRNYKMVIHLDGNKSNNHISNLKWVNNSQAQKLAVHLGLKPILWGEENPSSVSVCQYTSDGSRLIKRWGSIADIERELKIPHSNISKVCRGKRKSAGGYFWEYEF